MVRAVKSSATPASAAPVSVSVAESSAAPKAPRTKKVKAPVVEVSAPAVESASTGADVVADVVAAPTVVTKMTEFSAKLQQLNGLFSTIKNDFKTLEKTISREIKLALKATTKRRRTSGNRAPSGFVKPTRISDELAEFLGKTIGTEMARTSVSKEINAYIRTNSLQDKTNGRKIIPDAKLAKLLKLTKSDELTYFNLQKYMKHHFVKAVPAVSA
jgi:upstream activation factor subunit UAF30